MGRAVSFPSGPGGDWPPNGVVHFELKTAVLVTAITLKFSVKQVANL